jgi:hypothetical protein
MVLDNSCCPVRNENISGSKSYQERSVNTRNENVINQEAAGNRFILSSSAIRMRFRLSLLKFWSATEDTVADTI